MKATVAMLSLALLTTLAAGQPEERLFESEEEELAWESAHSPASADAPEQASAPASAPAPRTTPAHPSRFRSGTARDPFWPVGWSPPIVEDEPGTPEKPKALPVQWEEAAKQLTVTGIFRKGKRHLAMLKGVGVVEEGDIITVQYKELVYRWRVTSITPAGIVPKKLDASPLK